LSYSPGKVSLLCPTRGRANKLKKVIDSIFQTASNFELLITYDIDDKETEEVSYKLKDDKIIWYSKPRSQYLNRDYYNFMAQRSTGDYFWAIGDDVIFKTKDWDIILNNKIEEFLINKPDRIAYIITSEDNSKAKHNCFPLITKEAFNVLNMFLHPQLLTWGADRTIYEIYSHPSINRVVNIPEIHIDHRSYHDGTGEFDLTAQNVKERFFRDPDCHNKVSLYVVPQNIRILKEYIEDYNARMGK
jgi:hypothetical protein